MLSDLLSLSWSETTFRMNEVSKPNRRTHWHRKQSYLNSHLNQENIVNWGSFTHIVRNCEKSQVSQLIQQI